MIGLLIKLLPYVAPAIRYADDPKRSYWRLHLLTYAIIIWLVDMVLAHTVMVPYFGLPKIGEITISHTLERLYPVGNADAVRLALSINSVAPGHIKAAVK